MKFTIGTVSSNLEFSETMNLIKSSLLYADEIELIGMIEYAVFSYLPNRILNAKDLSHLLNCITPFIKSIDVAGGKELLEQIDGVSSQLELYRPILTKKKRRTKDEILAQMKMQQLMKQSQEEFSRSLAEMLNTGGSQALKSLIEREIVAVHDYSFDDFEVEELIGGYFGNLINATRNQTAYPLFDKTSEGVIKSAVDTHILDIGRLNSEVIRHAGVASNILMTLPTLEGASVDEILDFKKENEKELVLFRKAIYDFSDKINSLPWDDNFQYDCLKLYNTEVLPRVEEINTLASETSTLKNFGRQVLADEEIRKKAGWIAGGIATTIISQSSLMGVLSDFKNWLLGFSLITISPMIASGFLKTLHLGSKAKIEVKEKQKLIQGNTMYYYYKATIEL